MTLFDNEHILMISTDYQHFPILDQGQQYECFLTYQLIQYYTNIDL